MADIKISQLGEALAVTDNDILPMTASGVTSKVKASTMKSYMVDDLDVSDLHDTTITTPVDNDGFVYDATAQKWENKPVVTGDLWVKNGAHNLLYNRTSGANILGGITITTSSENKSIAVTSGTSTSNDSIMLSGSGTSSWTQAEQYLEAGEYEASINAGSVPIRLRLTIEAAGTHSQQDYSITGNNKQTFTITARCRILSYLEIENGESVPSGTLYPMIKRASDPSTAYAPYAKTNRELTEGLSAKADNYIHDASTDSYIFTMKTVNNTAQGYVGVSQMKFSPSLGKIFFYALDGTYMGETTYTPAT